MKAIRIHETGGPEVLRWEEMELPPPGPGQVRLRHTAVGLNFIDTYHRSGLYPLKLPAVLGVEAAGVVETVGEGVQDFAPGARVAYAGLPGAYTEASNLPASRLVPIPDEISDEQAAAILLKGMTVQYLLRRTYVVKQGDTILITAAAGGVGLLACQWAKYLGATVIGTVGSADKAKLAAAHGCDHVLLSREEDVPARVRALTEGAGVPVVYDSIGRDSFEASLKCLGRRGLLVSFGNASGPPPPLELGRLAQMGSLYVTRPTLADYTVTADELRATAKEVFDLVRADVLKVEINQRYRLQDAAEAHRDLEARRTTGSTVLIP